nr:MAG TPA: hypothetical protein [Caudoviricetes sp.]
MLKNSFLSIKLTTLTLIKKFLIVMPLFLLR